MALTIVDYNSYFNYKLSNKQITFTDETDYVSQGTAASNVTVVAKVTAPVTGVFYNNTNHLDPDINPGVSLDSLHEIGLPTDVNGLPEQGEYTVELTYVDSTVTATVVDTRIFTLDYTSPSIDISMTVDYGAPLLSATDTTNYTRNTINPTIVRAFEINYPSSLNLTPVAGTANVLTTNTFYTLAETPLQHSSSLTSDIIYEFDADQGFYLIDYIEGVEYVDVASGSDLCDIYCCLRTQYQRWQDNKTKNTQRANIELAKFEQIMSISGLIGTAVKCGKGDHISEYVVEILRIADCDAGCGCEDGTPQLVTGLGVSGDEVIVAEGTGISVAVADGGGGKTYTVSLSTANQTKLTNMSNTIVASGTNASVSSSSATVGGIQTFTYVVSATDTIVESLFVRCLLTLSAGVVPVITISSQNNYGSTFSTVNQSGTGTDFIENNNAGSYSEWASSYTDLDVQNFGVSSADYFPEVSIANAVQLTKGSNLTWINNLKADIIELSATEFKIRFSDASGAPVNGLALHEKYGSLELIFKIQK